MKDFCWRGFKKNKCWFNYVILCNGIFYIIRNRKRESENMLKCICVLIWYICNNYCIYVERNLWLLLKEKKELIKFILNKWRYYVIVSVKI